ncbi:tRNA (adenosine(37)-N6)-threonylcarbamoyltransferase complex ATPase subunit type 1 TsaE [Mucilaginibacter sp. SG564]|uniref:tRNA (adenosine(37)-N6)-threonylcarbamoyltransferase complex ATPase subunit type 1 TsaE n=1 Tax=Mucilaginibacter sp. SG564 TaxID=2587022 RepID=UPI001556B487|nr:tRNA threonylcarbamoyladenosine biosynthesis protein TsaE [Mucilaginibacter sp. SG564]
MLITVQSLADLPAVAEAIIAHAGNNRIFLFYGDMGAGKTTLIKSLCSFLGTEDTVTSPTFAIVNEYQRPEDKIYHFDFYRLKDQTEALDMGYEEYFYAGAYCFIEWPEKIPDLLPDHYTRISIKAVNNGLREVNMENV